MGEHAAQVVSLLGKPTSFLLFLFAVLMLFEFSSWKKTDRLVTVISEIMAGVETNRAREVANQQQLVSDLIDILEYQDADGSVQKESRRYDPLNSLTSP